MVSYCTLLCYLLSLCLTTVGQYLSQPLFFYQPTVTYYQPPVYQQQYGYPVQQFQHYQHFQQPQYYYPVQQYQTANSFADNLHLLREIAAVSNSRNREGNEFRDREGAYEEPNRLNTVPISLAEHSKYLSLISDKDNFQTSGCSWDLLQSKCVDGLGLCKGGCRDFAVTQSSALHDCRCIPYGYAALLKLAGK